MDPASLALGLGGLALGGLTVWLSFRERTSSYRLRLYERQTDAHLRILAALNDLHFEALAALTMKLLETHGKRALDVAERSQLRSQLVERYNALGTARYEVSILLPKRTAETIGHYREVFSAITSPAGVKRHPSELVSSLDPSTPLTEAYLEVLKAMREAVGTEALSAETLKLFGGPGS